MVTAYVPGAGDLIWIDFDPRAGREQGNRRPALVLTDQAYNRATGLAVVCPITRRRKPYPFALPVTIDRVEGVALVDHLQSLDWAARKAELQSQAEPALLEKVRGYLAVLLGLR